MYTWCIWNVDLNLSWNNLFILYFVGSVLQVWSIYDPIKNSSLSSHVCNEEFRFFFSAIIFSFILSLNNLGHCLCHAIDINTSLTFQMTFFFAPYGHIFHLSKVNLGWKQKKWFILCVGVFSRCLIMKWCAFKGDLQRRHWLALQAIKGKTWLNFMK